MKMRNRFPGAGSAALATLVVAMAAAMWSCDDGPVAPAAGGAPALMLGRGLHVYLTVSAMDAAPGAVVEVTAKVRPVGMALTPTAFSVAMRYDPDRLAPLALGDVNDGALRVANLEAGPGLARVAGASANGLGTETLFTMRALVRRAGYAAGLALAVEELDVIERNFADLAPQVRVQPQVVRADAVVLERPGDESIR